MADKFEGVQQGDQVCITIEGEVAGVFTDCVTLKDGVQFNKDQDGIVSVETLARPPVQFKPGDRLRRKLDDWYSCDPYEVTLGQGGYLHHGDGDSWQEIGPDTDAWLFFNSNNFEKVNA